MYPHMAYISMHMRHLVFCERKNPPNIEPWVRNWWFFCQLPADMPGSQHSKLCNTIMYCQWAIIWNLNTDRNSNAGRMKAVWSCCRRTQLLGTNSEDYPIMASHLCFHWGLISCSIVHVNRAQRARMSFTDRYVAALSCRTCSQLLIVAFYMDI